MENHQSVLVLAEHDNLTLTAGFLNVIASAKKLSFDITVLVAGYHCQSVANDAAEVEGVTRVLLADNEVYQYQLAENISLLVSSLAQNYQYILAASSSFGKDVLPRVAALLDMSCISDIVSIIDNDIFIRPIYAGNALVTLQSTDPIKIMTVRTTAFSAIKKTQPKAKILDESSYFVAEHTHFVDRNLSMSERPSLTSARIVISGGRGLGSGENFNLILSLADKLGAAVGASRAAVDAGFVSNDYQVGQTGKVVAPELYIAVGISGAVQHLAGMKDSKVIVAINKDSDAPIFKVADYGLVGDLFEILAELDKAIPSKN